MQTFLCWLQEYHKILIYGIGFILLHFIILKGIKKFHLWLEQLQWENFFTQKIFDNLKQKIYLLWLFFLCWALTKSFDLSLAARLFKSVTSFIFCLILGHLVGLGTILCFKNLIKDIDTFYPLLNRVLLFVFSILGCIVAANNIGYSLSGFLTTLGIGGAAFAFAAQNTIANLWATVSILLDRPFKEGDWISIGTRAQGQVKAIGLRSTRICNEQGNIIVIPNSIIVNECIENLKTKNFK